MTAITTPASTVSRGERRSIATAITLFRRAFTLFAAAGRAVPFHREEGSRRAGSYDVVDRDTQRALAELNAISTIREHG
ncbi:MULTISPECIES: hypothetical protein [unclassified Nocardia]|uniref:hypothetical protein n=2 Tax=Nocardia TaxID=1817 RepID=UPI00278BD5CF|nr:MULTISPECIES: hypothetical protein [unclassified Nocardia]